MTGAARRIVIVTSRYPFGHQEPYLGTELVELARHFEHIAIVPVRPPEGEARRMPPGVELLAWPLLNAELVRRAGQALGTSPRRVFSAVSLILRSHDPGRTKNLAVIVKALALGQWATEHGVDHIHSYWISTPATVAMLAAAVSRVRWSSTAHRWDIYERNALDVKERSVSFVRTISKRGTDDIRERMPALGERVLQLRLGAAVPEAPVFVRAAPGDLRIICPAALVPVKGHRDLLTALAILRTRGLVVRCTIAGTGPLRAGLEERAAQLHLSDAVEFTGFVPQQTLHEWYRAGRFAAVVLASKAAGSHTMEGVPSALIEAMAHGVPIVATDSGSVGELVDEDCGMLVRPGDPEDLARALSAVFEDPQAAQTRALRAYRVVSERHDVRIQMRALAAALSGKGV